MLSKREKRLKMVLICTTMVKSMREGGAAMPKSSPILCGSIAGSIGGTGIVIHNAAYRAAGLPYTYVSFEPSSAKEAAQAMRTLGIRGLGVSMPYKLEIIEYLDRLDDTAQKIGAVNTIVNDGGILTGYNTDWTGAIDGLKEVIDLRGKKVAMFGAGGVARAILYGLSLEGAETFVFNNNEARGKALCAEFGASYMGAVGRYEKADGYEVVINATSVGYQSEETILRAEQLPVGCAVLDVVAVPMVTCFMREAEKAGCRVVPGYKMLLLQAIAQDELYTGQRPMYEVMEKALMEKLEREKNRA